MWSNMATNILIILRIMVVILACFIWLLRKHCVFLKTTMRLMALSPLRETLGTWQWGQMFYQRALRASGFFLRTLELPVTSPLLYHWAIANQYFPIGKERKTKQIEQTAPYVKRISAITLSIIIFLWIVLTYLVGNDISEGSNTLLFLTFLFKASFF